MDLTVVWGLLLPLIGTALGAACVFLLRRGLADRTQRSLTGFAAGVMTAASVWSLLIPAMEQSAGLGRWAFLPAAAGFWLGVLFLLALDHLVPHLHQKSQKAEGPRSRLRRTTMLTLAVTLHNIPEGMAVGAVYAGLMAENAQITLTGAIALSVGIAIQNFPAFWWGALSGAVEPAAALLTILAAGRLAPALPVLLSFAAGAMLYVVVEELIPETAQGEHSNAGVLAFAAGFSLMMALDVALG